ncbi:hypothetical protein ACIT1K_001151 [Raoultella planticola]|uniref:hypothetical protein n=1 Tax=Raoultella planticola TaxID=575 RepID=UPI0028EBDEC0
MVKYTAKQPDEDGTKRQRDSQRLHSCIDAIRLAFKGSLQDLLLTHQSYCSSPHTAIRFAANIRLKKLRRTLCMTDTAANEIAPHLPLLFENEANGILQDPIGAGIVLYLSHGSGSHRHWLLLLCWRAYLLWSRLELPVPALVTTTFSSAEKSLAQAAKPICQRYRLWQIGLVCFQVKLNAKAVMVGSISGKSPTVTSMTGSNTTRVSPPSRSASHA